MADNTTINLGSGGDVIASDDILGVKHQRVKVEFGADGVATDVSAANPLPVSGAFFQTTQPVSGTVAVSNMVAQGLTDAQIRATALPVSGAFFQATQPVSGVVTVTANGLISTANSSAVALAANAVYTGAAEDVTEFADVRVSIITDQASAVDGLQIQQSSNGTNWDIVDAYAIPVTTGKVFSVAANAKFMRIVYTNGATAQTVLRLQTKLQKTYSKGSSLRPQDARTNDNDYEEMLSHSMVYNGTTWDRQRGTIANGIAVDVTRLPALAAGVAVIGALTANQSVNTSQIAGVATAAGSGVVTTGTQRMVLATDVVLPAMSEARGSPLHITATALVNTGATATLPAPAAGLFHYITSIQLVKLYAALGVASAAGVVITSTNLPGGFAWTTEQIASAVGTAPLIIDYQPTTPLKASAAAVATTLVAPAQLQTIWRWNVSYFTAA